MSFNRRTSYFNMIEVVLALVVLTVGVVTIMGLLPVALKASRDSVADNVVPLVADNVRAYLNRLKTQGWTAFSSGAALSDAEPTSGLEFANVASIESNTSNVFPISVMPEFALYHRSTNDLFIAKIRSGDLNGAWPFNDAATDFSALVKVWRSDMTELHAANSANTSLVTSSSEPVPRDYGVRVNVEIRWPLEAADAVRERRRYVFEYIPEL